MSRDTRNGTPGVRATFADLDHARKAVDALERAGIDAAHISLTGPAIEEAEAHTQTGTRDARVARRVGGRVLIGAVAGAFAGTVLGLIVVAWADGGSLALSIAILGGGLLGATFGAVTGGVSALPMTEEWDLTYDETRRSQSVVAVSSEDPGDVEKATDALSRVEPVRIERVDSGGGRRLAG